MAIDNTVTIIGNITRDPELRYTPGGQQLASFGVAVNRVWNDRASNERKEQVSFFDVTCWGDLADNVCESLGKGNRVIVSGRLEQRSWDDQDGNKKSKVEIIADEVAPSLRWATAEVKRTERRGPQQGGGGSYGDPGPTPPSGGGSSAGSYDEEPF